MLRALAVGLALGVGGVTGTALAAAAAPKTPARTSGATEPVASKKSPERKSPGQRPAGQPPAGQRTADRAAVEARLRAVDAPPTASDLQALGSGVDEVLLAVASDPKVEILVRARAVSSLAYFPTPPARGYLEAAVSEKASSKDPGERLLLRKAAMAFGWQGGTTAVKTVGPLLEHPDPDVRSDAAFALGLTRMTSAAELLRLRAPIELDARVRRQVERQLRILDDALRATSGTTSAPRPRESEAAAEAPRRIQPPATGSLRTRGSQ